MERITIFDTTLREGVRSPDATMTPAEKLRVAEELDALGVDVLEVGFPAASVPDFETVARIAREIQRPVIAAVAAVDTGEVDRAGEALADAQRPRIHVSTAIAEAGLAGASADTRDACLERVEAAVARARELVADVQFSVEGAVGTDLAFLCQVMSVAARAGARTLGLGDRRGYAVPGDWGRLLEALFASVQGMDEITVAVRCRDDLGLALANTLAAIQAGARQVDCTLNGIGERAGNTALEEVVVALRVRPDLGPFETAVHPQRLGPASRLLAHITGLRMHPHKAIVGEHAFSRPGDATVEGDPQRPETDPLLTPELVGAGESKLVLGPHSDRQALVARLEELGYTLEPDQIDDAYDTFRALAATKKSILDEDLLAIYYQGTLDEAPRHFVLEHLHVECGHPPARATVRVREGGGPAAEATAQGDGPVDATFAALQQVVSLDARLRDFAIQSTSPGKDALGEVHLRLSVQGDLFTGRATSTDVVEAAARAFLNAMDKAAHTRMLEARSFERQEYWGV